MKDHAAPRSTAGATGDVASAMASWQLAALAPMGRIGPAWLAAMQATADDVTRFAARRLGKDAETQAAMLECRTLTDLQQVQLAAMTEAVRDYRDEAARLAGIAQTFLAETVRAPEAGPPS